MPFSKRIQSVATSVSEWNNTKIQKLLPKVAKSAKELTTSNSFFADLVTFV